VTGEDVELEIVEGNPHGFTKDGYHADRWWYHYPWKWTRPWLPRYGWGSDEYCNPTWYGIAPLLGGIVIRFKPGPIRTEADGRCELCQAFEDEPKPYSDWNSLLAKTVHQWPKALPLRVTVWPPLSKYQRVRDIQIHGVGWTMTWRKRFKDWDPSHVEYMVRDYLRCTYGESMRGLALLRLAVEWRDTCDVVPAEP
jgi:hypothetical protein